MNPMGTPASMFSGMQFVPGLGYVQQQGPMGSLGGGGAQLGDDAAVMMISGFSAGVDIPSTTTVGLSIPGIGRNTGIPDPIPPGAGTPVGGGAQAPNALEAPTELLGITMPLWHWLGIGALLIGGGAYLWWRK